MQQQQASTLRELDIGYYINRYLSLFWRWKLWIFFAGPIVSIGWIIYVLEFGSIKPDLEAVATIFIDSEQGPGVSRYDTESNLSGTEFIKSRNFLTSVVHQLSLRLTVNDHGRYTVLDSVQVDTSALSGKYRFVLDNEVKGYHLYFTSSEYGVRNKLVESGDLHKLNSLYVNGVYLLFSDGFLKNPFGFTYNISPLRISVDRLMKSVSVENRSLVRNGPVYVSITNKGSDYRVIAQTANTIVDKFIDMSQGARKQRTKEGIAVLEKQLEIASEQLRVAQDSVEQFQNRYPNVGLGAELMNNVNMLATLESGSASNTSWADEAQRIRNRLAMAIDDDQFLYVREALVFLAGRGVTAAAVLQQEFSQLTLRKQELITGYDRSHPYVQENNKRIAEVKIKADAFLSEYASSASDASVRQMNQMRNMASQLRGLPILQAKLAELERQAQVTSRIHSDVLSRFNQAKIVETTKMDGIYVMDYAIEPVPPSDFMNMLIKIGMGILIGLSVSFGIPVLSDFLDKTARSENDLSKMLDYTILESIPEIRKKGSTQKSRKGKKKEAFNDDTSATPKIRSVDEKLITADYTPDFTNELFRSLRAKIMLRMHDLDKKMILVSSHGMSEGKSLICSNLAITMAQQKLRTVLIDGDIRRGVLHNSFVLHKKPGLSNFLFSESAVTLDSTRELLQNTHVPNLSIISSGINVPNPSELLSLPRFKMLLEYLNELFDVIILDTPPLCVAADAAIAITFFSACVIVVRAGSTNVIDLRKRLQEFPNLRKKIIGVVLNGGVLDRKMREYKYSMYHY